MKKASIIYEETGVLTAKYHHPKSDDWLKYIARIQIKDSGGTLSPMSNRRTDAEDKTSSEE